MGAGWVALTEGQGAVISSLITVSAATVGIILGWFLFNGRVLNLKDAIDRSEEMLNSYRADMDKTLQKLSADLQNFQRLTQESLSQVNLSVDDLQSVTRSPSADSSEHSAADDEAAQRREEIRQYWYPIRDHVEHLATDPALDAQLRNKYARMDRRSYMTFIEALANDGVFGSAASLYSEAASLWQAFRAGRSTPSPTDVDEMRRYHQQLVPNARRAI